MDINIKNNHRGFSLVELIIVIGIMAILAGTLAPTLIDRIEKSREASDLQNIATIRRTVGNAMSEQTVYDEIMNSIIDNKIIIDLGETKDAGFDSSDIEKYPNFQKKVKEVLASDIEIKSSVALTDGNHLLIEITSEGVMSVYIANSSTADSSKAIQCKKTTDANGVKTLFLVCK